jgi:hypothetical protein
VVGGYEDLELEMGYVSFPLGAGEEEARMNDEALYKGVHADDEFPDAMAAHRADDAADAWRRVVDWLGA